MLKLPRNKRAPSPAHQRSPHQERDAAKRLGGRVVKGSGSGPEKGDVRVKGVLRLEAKCTSKNSFSVTREMVRKIEEAALGAGEVPAIEIEFLDADGAVDARLLILPSYALDRLLNER